MSRIAPATGAFARVARRAARALMHHDMPSVGVYARHPRLLVALARYNRAVEREDAVPHRLKELASLRAAGVVGCEYCLDIGSALARRAGFSDAQLLALSDAHASGLFSDDELLVIDLAEGMSGTPAHAGEETIDALTRRFGEKGVMELVHMVAWENARARTNHALGIAPDGFSTGCVIAPADAAARPVAA